MSAIFNRNVEFIGRTGGGTSIGLVFSSHQSSQVVTIEPITPDNHIGPALIAIPAEAIPSVIDELQMYLDSVKPIQINGVTLDTINENP